MLTCWAGVYLFYGPAVYGYLKSSFALIRLRVFKHLLHGGKSSLWKSLLPFSIDDVFSDGGGASMHDLERHLKVEFKIIPGRKRVDPREWLTRFTTIQDTPGSHPARPDSHLNLCWP